MTRWVVGLGVLAAVISGLLYTARWQEIPSPSRGYFTLYGKCDPNSRGIIKNPPKQLKFVIAPERDNNCAGYGIIKVDLAELSKQKQFRMRMVNGALVIDELSFAVESEDVKGLGGEGYQRETTAEGHKITYFVDDIPNFVKGQYVLKGNTVEKHFYFVSKTWPMFLLVVMVIVVGLGVLALLLRYGVRQVSNAVEKYRKKARD